METMSLKIQPHSSSSLCYDSCFKLGPLGMKVGMHRSQGNLKTIKLSALGLLMPRSGCRHVLKCKKDDGHDLSHNKDLSDNNPATLIPQKNFKSIVIMVARVVAIGAIMCEFGKKVVSPPTLSIGTLDDIKDNPFVKKLFSLDSLTMEDLIIKILKGSWALAIGFMGKKLIENGISGLWLSIKPHFCKGDTIKIGSVQGEVKSVGLMNTTLMTAEKMTVLIPNSVILTGAISKVSLRRSKPIMMKLDVGNIEKLYPIGEEVKNYLKSKSFVALEDGEPTCNWVKLGWKKAKLNVEFNLIIMGEADMMASTEEVFRAIESIINSCGGEVERFEY